MLFATKFYDEELRFKIRILGFASLGKTVQTYEADGEILELSIELTNLLRKEITGWRIGRTLVLEDEEGNQFRAGETDLQKITKKSYRFADIIPNKPFPPKIPARCSILFEVPNAEGKYRLTVREHMLY